MGILGGTFNPPHLGHLILANEVRHSLQLDEVRLMPTANPPHKEFPGDATAEQRFQMVELAVENIDGVSAFSFEIDRGGVSYTYETILELKKIEPETEFYFIIGGDMVDTLHTWHKIEELMELISFVGVRRPGSDGVTHYPITVVDIPSIDLSSTMIRNRIRNNGSVQLLVPEAVESFIVREGLYGSKGNSK